ncbi:MULTISPECIES: hypothetical protein [Nostocales]|uniref:Lipoprotein n=3 Tax=Nostocales TaxID=1161 RepID=A0A0C1MZ24_9CYAN|nr:hypothetical protein [Tolypothrix bouteillei]KAF3888936.1 hypothetical protein DA73_0400028210 [Tolypothrix bouteillei VB521301]
MKTRRALAFLLFTICALLAFCIPEALISQQANAKVTNDLSCRGAVTGTYVTTVTDANGNFASRAVFTLADDGNLFNIDSRVDGGGLFNPFTNAQGRWKCVDKNEIAGKAVNWVLRSDPERSRTEETNRQGLLEYKNVKIDGDKIEGLFELNFYNIKANTLDGSAVPDRFVGTFFFKGQRISVD